MLATIFTNIQQSVLSPRRFPTLIRPQFVRNTVIMILLNFEILFEEEHFKLLIYLFLINFLKFIIILFIVSELIFFPSCSLFHPSIFFLFFIIFLIKFIIFFLFFIIYLIIYSSYSSYNIEIDIPWPPKDSISIIEFFYSRNFRIYCHLKSLLFN